MHTFSACTPIITLILTGRHWLGYPQALRDLLLYPKKTNFLSGNELGPGGGAAVAGGGGGVQEAARQDRGVAVQVALSSLVLEPRHKMTIC